MACCLSSPCPWDRRRVARLLMPCASASAVGGTLWRGGIRMISAGAFMTRVRKCPRRLCQRDSGCGCRLSLPRAEFLLRSLRRLWQRLAGSLSGFMNMGAQAGSALTAVSTPAIAALFGWTASFLTSAAFCVVGGILWLLINPNHAFAPCDSHPQAPPN